jgi:hypothetical protein
MKWIKASLVVQILLALYFQMIIWFPLGAWNDQRGDRLIEVAKQGHAALALGFALIALSPVLFFALAVTKKWFWLMWLGLAGYVVWAIMQVNSWWKPWLFGPTQRDLENAKALDRTYKIFSSSPRHIAPDAMHFVLDLLLFSVVVTLALGLFSQLSRTRRSSQ